MKKILLLSLFLTALTFTAEAQTKFGVGGTYVNDFGVQGRANFPLTDEITAIPNASFYFGTGTQISIDALGAYTFTEIEDMPVYGLGGLGYFSGTSGSVTILGIPTTSTSFSTLTLTLGAGIEVTENVYAELFWRNGFNAFSGSNLGINAGYYF